MSLTLASTMQAFELAPSPLTAASAGLAPVVVHPAHTNVAVARANANTKRRRMRFSFRRLRAQCGARLLRANQGPGCAAPCRTLIGESVSREGA
jgi:hypothetical protein